MTAGGSENGNNRLHLDVDGFFVLHVRMCRSTREVCRSSKKAEAKSRELRKEKSNLRPGCKLGTQKPSRQSG